MDKRAQIIRVAIVEDDAGIREGLAEMLHRIPDCRVVGVFSDGKAAVDGLRPLKPHVVLTDINMPIMDGVECVRILSETMPDTEFVMLTIYEDTDTIFKALEAGACGYLLKPVSLEALANAVRDASTGGAPMTSSIARQVVRYFTARRSARPMDPETQLGPREEDVLRSLSRGDTYIEIATQLGISYSTVHTYIKRIYQKLHVHSRGQAVAQFLSSAKTDGVK
jgi:DNA-binding NarL/FixJ family response regulator